nr:MAG TPA: Tail tape measure [Caudoviricetes sp.]
MAWFHISSGVFIFTCKIHEFWSLQNIYWLDTDSSLVCTLGHFGCNQREAEMKQMIAVILLIAGVAIWMWANWKRGK